MGRVLNDDLIYEVLSAVDEIPFSAAFGLGCNANSVYVGTYTDRLRFCYSLYIKPEFDLHGRSDFWYRHGVLGHNDNGSAAVAALYA